MRLLFLSLLATAMFTVSVICAIGTGIVDGALAAMSIDLGSQYIKMALVKTGVPMEIVLNKESRRKTPNLLAIRNKERFFADAALTLALKYPKSAYPYLVELIAKKDDDPAVAEYRKQFPFSDLSNTGRSTMQITADGETYDIESLVAMILWSAKKTTEAYAEQSVKDVVITVPAFFNQAERRAIAVAADIAGLNLLQILNSGSAAALNYGVFRRKEITEQSSTMLIYDMGAVKTEATIVEMLLVEDKDRKTIKNPVVRTIGYGFDRSLGGLEMTLRVQKHLEEKFRKEKKTPTDIATNPRSMAKLHKEAERVKQVLSANSQTFAQIENVHEDTDFRTEMKREQFEALIADLDERVKKPITDALKMAELEIKQVDQIVLMGAGTRVPRVKSILSSAVGGRELSNFLNTDEAIALGAVYQAARLSNSFKVLPFDVQEVQLYPIQVSLSTQVKINFLSKDEEGNTKPVAKTLFNYKTFYPAPKKIVTLTSYDDDFDFHLNYGKLDHLDERQMAAFGSANLSKVSVTGVKEKMTEAMSAEGSIFKGIKLLEVHVGIDLSGIVSVQRVDVNIEQPPPPQQGAWESLSNTLSSLRDGVKNLLLKKEAEVEQPSEGEEKTNEDEKKEEKEKDGDKEEETKKKDDSKKDDSKKDDSKKDDKKEEEKKKKKEEPPKPKKVRTRLAVSVEELDLVMLDEKEIGAVKQRLRVFEEAEKEKEEHEEAMNALEATLYDLHDKLETGEGVIEYLTSEERADLTQKVATLRTWMEDEAGFETTTAEFKEKKKVVDDIIKDGRKKMKEHLAFPKLDADMIELFNHSSTFLATSANLTKKTDDSEDGVFTATEIEVLQKKHDEVTSWWEKKKAERDAVAKSAALVVTKRDVEEKGAELQREVKYLLNKLMSYKPKPKKEGKTEGKAGEKSEANEAEEKTKENGAENAAGDEKVIDETTHDSSDL